MENESSAVVLSSRTLTREVAKHWKYFLIVVQVGCCCILVILLSLITSSCYQKYGTIKTLISQYQLSQQVSAIFLHAPYSLSLLYSLQTQGDFGSDRSKESLLLANLTAENRLL